MSPQLASVVAFVAPASLVVVEFSIYRHRTASECARVTERSSWIFRWLEDLRDAPSDRTNSCSAGKRRIVHTSSLCQRAEWIGPDRPTVYCIRGAPESARSPPAHLDVDRKHSLQT